MTTFDEPHEKLRQLAINAQRQPPLSDRRRIALNELFREIAKTTTIGKLKAILKGKHLAKDIAYEDLFNEALQETLIAMSKNIDSYNDQRHFLNWTCGILSNKFSDVQTKYSNRGIKSLPASNYNNNEAGNKKEIQILSLDQVDQFVADEENEDSDCDLLRQLLIDDPDNIFQREHVRGKPEANFQYIAIAIYVEEKTWQEISTDLDIPLPTLHSFFSRRLKRIEPYLRNKLQP